MEEFGATLDEPSPVPTSMDLNDSPEYEEGLDPALIAAGKKRMLEVLDLFGVYEPRSRAEAASGVLVSTRWGGPGAARL